VSRFLNRTFPLCLALVALVWGQLFGFQIGYVAEVDGRIVQTNASHHHAGDTLNSGHFVGYTPHSHGHHHDHDQGTSSHHHDDEEPLHAHDHDPVSPDDDHRHHVPLVDQPELTQLLPPASAPPLVLLALWEYSDFLLAMQAIESVPALIPPLAEPDRSPPASLLVVQCMVMLV
jgi:hypothetical protein